MAYTQADLIALDAAIASQELEVEHNGKRVRFRSMAELLQARAHVASLLAASSGTRQRAYRFNFSTQRGD